ncbi:MAG: 3-phosphoshikimate 1-carboxyvinyltransferase [Myxococcota bacterium]
MAAHPSLPDPLPIAPRGPLDARVRVPGSKSLTNRALLVAALASGPSKLRGGLASDDTEAMRDALTALGCAVDTGGEVWNVVGSGGSLQAPAAPLDTRNSGTTARFVTAAAALANGPVVIDGNARMRERPISDLTEALAGLGVRCEILGRNGCPPVRVEGGGLPGGETTIDARRSSSQYVSAILLAAPYAEKDVRLNLAGGEVISRPYVDLTLRIMQDFGAEAGWASRGTLQVTAGRPYQGRDHAIEADASAAVYPFCAAAIAGGTVRVEGIVRDSLQSDFRILDCLEAMGCGVRRGPDWAEVTGAGTLRPIDADLNDLPDAALALAVVTLFADGPSTIRNVPNLRIKETDRLAALETELCRLGATARAGEDDLRIEPGKLHGADVHTYDDHRIAMSFALAGLRVPGVRIQDPGCVAKTWPEYFSFLEHL